MIERLYEVFAAPRPRVVDYCDHCVDPADIAPFTTVPLRELTADQVEKYWLRCGTIGDETFRRYLLPRVLDLIAADDLDADFFWLRMATEAHAKGDRREQAVLQEYFLATPRALAVLVQETAEGSLATWLCGPEPLAALEEAALAGPDPNGVISDAHLVLEAQRSSEGAE
ncbi:hypothetical protein ACIA8G_23455 [Lentzea sp. NPDC051213]|uniref:hypothetical protein n=1 Tax=Lentzea sp. NPDC051213 TaxID=3364126 RepID=UPI0037B7F523